MTIANLFFCKTNIKEIYFFKIFWSIDKTIKLLLVMIFFRFSNIKIELAKIKPKIEKINNYRFFINNKKKLNHK